MTIFSFLHEARLGPQVSESVKKKLADPAIQDGGHIGFWGHSISRYEIIAGECVIPLKISMRNVESIYSNIFGQNRKSKMAMAGQYNHL